MPLIGAGVVESDKFPGDMLCMVRERVARCAGARIERSEAGEAYRDTRYRIQSRMDAPGA